MVIALSDGALPRYLGVTAWGAYIVKSSRNLNTPKAQKSHQKKAEVGIGLMMPAHHSSRFDFHFWILLLLFIASPQGTVLKIQVLSCWKSLADQYLNLSALFKSGSKTDPLNYRPVSLTCILCKVYEKILRDEILYFVESKISPDQHGFVKGKSCLSNLLDDDDDDDENL